MGHHPRHENRESIGSGLIDKYLEMNHDQQSMHQTPDIKNVISPDLKRMKQGNLSFNSQSQQWYDEKIHLQAQKVEDLGFQLQMKEQQITKLQNRISADKINIEKFDKELQKFEKFKRDQELRQRKQERELEAAKDEI
jgi:predicted RNase H-like nuclease (RuvC/YqgF family)